MENVWFVHKTGASMFDQLHACGLAILLNCLTGSHVKMLDIGVAYRLETAVDLPNYLPDDLWQRLFPLPTEEDLTNDDLKNVDDIALSVFDGLLALLFTSKGARVLSVNDVKWKGKYMPGEIDKGLLKAQQGIDRWEKYVSQLINSERNWLSFLNTDYLPGKTPNFLPAPKKQSGFSIIMTLDPSFSFATRRPTSDHQITSKCNVTFLGTPYAPLLAYIGASRWLRAQRVGGNLVNYYVPMIQELDIDRKTTMPLLEGSTNYSQQMILHQWLTTFLKVSFPLKGLAYQVLQTQGANQSISINRGYLAYQWLQQLQNSGQKSVLFHWRSLLRKTQKECPFELDLLQAALLHPLQFSTWTRHFQDKALHLIKETNKKASPRKSRSNAITKNYVYPYSYETVKEIANQMSPNNPMRVIMNRKNGTLRFGHALRQLGRHIPSDLQDTIAELQSVRSQNQLLQALAKANQACLVAKAKNEFIVVPNDEDVLLLLDDITAFGAQEIATLLIILSTLNYASKKDDQNLSEEETSTQIGADFHEKS